MKPKIDWSLYDTYAGRVIMPQNLLLYFPPGQALNESGNGEQEDIFILYTRSSRRASQLEIRGACTNLRLECRESQGKLELLCRCAKCHVAHSRDCGCSQVPALENMEKILLGLNQEMYPIAGQYAIGTRSRHGLKHWLLPMKPGASVPLPCQSSSPHQAQCQGR